MVLKDIIDIIGAEDQVIYLLVEGIDNVEWCGAFPACCVPTVYDNYKVKSIMPDQFEGESPLCGLVLKIWCTERAT